MSKQREPTPMATRLSNWASASSSTIGRAGESIEFWAAGSGSKILVFRSQLRSSRSPALPTRWSPVSASTITVSTISWGEWSSLSPTTPISIAASWRDAFLPLPQNIGPAAALMYIGKPRAFVHLRSNSSLTRWGSFMTGTGLRAIVGPPPTHWRKRFPALGGWHSRPSWNARDNRRGGYGRGMPPLRRRICSRPTVTSGAQGCRGDRNPGIAMWPMPIRHAEVSWLRQNVMGPDQAVRALRITARERYSDRCWAWGESLGIVSERAIDRSEGRWSRAMKADIVRAGRNDKLV